MEAIKFYINSGSRKVQLPVNPEELTVTYEGNNDTVDIVKLGEVNILKDRKLTSIEFESFFPYLDWFPGIVASNVRKPKWYRDYLQKIMDSKRPCRLVITGYGISMQVAIESFEFKYQGGDYEDAYYSLELKEYRPHRIVDITPPPVEAPLPEDGLQDGLGDKPPEVAPKAPENITIGCSVILNGRVHYDSYGAKPGKTFTNYRGKISHINRSGSHPYHVTQQNGGWLGWVTAESVVLA